MVARGEEKKEEKPKDGTICCAKFRTSSAQCHFEAKHTHERRPYCGRHIEAAKKVFTDEW